MNKKSVTLICNARLPSEKAHPWQVLQMWQAFAHCSSQSILLYPFRFQKDETLNKVGREFWKYYDLPEAGPSWRLPNLELSPLLDFVPSFVSIYSRLQQSTFALASALWFCDSAHKDTLVWTREILSLPLLNRLHPKIPVFYEMHRFPGSQIKRQLSWLNKINGVICLTEKMKEELIEAKYPAEKIIVQSDAYNAKLFDTLPNKDEALRALGLDKKKKKIVYTGHLYKWKGVDSLVEAMKLLPQHEAYLVGGMPEDRKALRSRHAQWPENVICHDHVPPNKIPLYMAIADLAVVPNSGNSVLSRHYTSPLKLFEILAAAVPLVLSDLPSLREVVSEDMAHLFKPDDPVALAKAIEDSLNEEPEAKKSKIQKGRQRVEGHNWSRRAQNIYDFMLERS